ncbi:bifunctional UDP-N-acetylglucosamine diphosphorylase/glucosamine-1-phosphate N-acetyltransferase GlmU [Stackebrandtia soli]|uniref:bifunctional UDP-N-acetylglucosamine diphosphorylase/glucosamine-1-phosphate N-acetyltransferase GlmU n=1 Tax=Stackebrandtia soli TaxID=1892856 RepID=UPI0039ED02DA
MSAARVVVVLAAGMGTRMKSALPKVLHPMLGRSLLGHVLNASRAVRADHTVVVVGKAGGDRVTEHVTGIAPQASIALQPVMRGTGDAARVALNSLPDVEGTVVVLGADTPLLRPETVEQLAAEHEASGRAATVLTARVADPAGFGRIVRDRSGDVVGIVEHRDADPEQLRIDEINSGIYAFTIGPLRSALSRLTTDNDQGEEYLTDTLELLMADGHGIGAFVAADAAETLGCNDRAQFAGLRSLLRDRINTELMRAGVTMDDPASTWVDVTAVIEPDVTLRPGVQVEGATRIASGAVIGPDSTLVDTVVGENATVTRAHCVEAEVGPSASVGPYAYLRPAAVLLEGAKVGTFVEVKKSTVGEGAKVPHLTYAGDATIGAGANIGAGTIFANYDGVAKHPTDIGEAVFVGSNSVLVAPVAIGDGAYVAAGSAVAEDVPPGALGVARGRQHNSDGWVERRRAGTKSADAAKRAGSSD